MRKGYRIGLTALFGLILFVVLTKDYISYRNSSPEFKTFVRIAKSNGIDLKVYPKYTPEYVDHQAKEYCQKFAVDPKGTIIDWMITDEERLLEKYIIQSIGTHGARICPKQQQEIIRYNHPIRG